VKRMKIYLILFLSTCFAPLAKCQDILVKSSFEKIEYVEDIEWHGEGIYCAGYTFKTRINDGNSADAYLVHYDTMLKPKWSLTVNDSHSNIIHAISRHKDKLYALVTQGTVAPLKQSVFLSLFTINLDGVIEDKISFGRSFHSPSNIVINGTDLIFGYRITNGITYSSSFKSEIIKYNLDTKKFVRFKSTQYQERPKKILVNGSDIFLFGIYLNPNYPNIMAYRNGKYSEISLKPRKLEYFIDSYIQDTILTVVCTFPGVYGDMNPYMKFYYINLANKAITSKVITYKQLGWTDVRFNAFGTGTTSWLTIKDDQTKALQYALMDKNGKVSRSMNFDNNNGNGYWENYELKKDRLLRANHTGITLYKIP
jgi:hypothetical protein